MYALIYTSIARPQLSDTDINAILKTARAFNSRSSITGLLSYDGSCFIQQLEGAKDGVHELLESIRNDPRHSELQIKWEDAVPERSFARWSMQFVDLSQNRADRVEELMKILPSRLPEELRSTFRHYSMAL